VEFGGVLVVAGANGSGKSTLLRIIAGLLHPTGGDAGVSVGGRPLDSVGRRAQLGYVAPDLVLYRELTGAENLQLFGRLRGLDLSRDRQVELLERVGLKGRGRDLVANYSSGMRQRLKYAFALLHEPPILLLDEPTTNLDAAGAEMARGVVEEQRRRGLAIVATNEQTELGWGDAVVALAAG
jgi:heme exporter protein A